MIVTSITIDHAPQIDEIRVKKTTGLQIRETLLMLNRMVDGSEVLSTNLLLMLSAVGPFTFFNCSLNFISSASNPKNVPRNAVT